MWATGSSSSSSAHEYEHKHDGGGVRAAAPAKAESALSDDAAAATGLKSQPRRMSVSDHELLTKAAGFTPTPAWAVSVTSRPGSADASQRLQPRLTQRTRRQVPTSQRIASAGGTIDRAQTEVFCLAYSNDSDLLVAGCGDGSLRVFGTSDYRLQTVLHHSEDAEHLPTTCMQFRPSEGADERQLLVATADGVVSHWDLSTTGSSSCERSFHEPSTSVYAVAYRFDGRQFATGGRDHIVRVYDEETDKLVRAFDNVGAHGHSNRIFSIKWHPRESHVLVSGGWDNTIQVFDDRTGFSVRSIYGPHLCGDSLACEPVSGDQLLTASWREEYALQRWDFGSGKLIDNIPWNGAASVDELPRLGRSRVSPTCMLYACAYSPDGRTIAAGGAGNGVNQGKLFDASSGEATDRVIFAHGMYALAFQQSGGELAMAGVDPQLTVVTL